jgi:hypothetical protein
MVIRLLEVVTLLQVTGVIFAAVVPGAGDGWQTTGLPYSATITSREGFVWLYRLT